MWIIPKNLPIFHYVQDMEGLILDSQELSDQLEQSVLWRSKVSQSRTWYRRLKKDCSLQLLFSQTLKSSIGSSLVEKWTYSQEAFLVSHLASQEESKEIKTLDIYGHTSQKGLNSWEDLPLFSSKTFQESSQASSKETAGQIKRGLQFCFMSLESWKDWVTKQRLAHSQRLKLARHTKGKECSFLVSEMNSNRAELILSMDSSNQMNQINPQHGQRQEGKHNFGMSRLESQWPTPTAGMEIREIGAKVDLFKRRKSLKKQIGLQGTITLDNQKFVGNLNPRWVETIMGLPIGWTMPTFLNPVKIELMNSDCLEMELFRTQHQKLSNSYGKNWHTPTTLDSREHSMIASYKDRKCGKSRKGEGLSRQILETFNEQRLESFILHLQKSCPESKKLSKEFDECILGHNGKQFIYSSERIFEKLIKDSKSKIKQGLLDHYDDTSLEDSALIYAIEDFNYNFESIKGEFDPVYLEDTSFYFKD